LELQKQILKISSGNRAIYRTPSKGLPQLFCLHGGMGLSADSLFDGLESISDLFDLIFIDQRGCGDSDNAVDGSYSIDDFVDDLKEIVDQIGEVNIKGLFGHSLGGMVAIKALAKYPELFQFGILSNTAMNDAWRADSKKAVEKLDSSEVAQSLAVYSEKPNDDQSIRNLAIVYGPIYFPELAEVDAKTQMERFTYRIASSEFLSASVYPGMNLNSEVRQIKCPILGIGGANDIVVPPQHLNAVIAELSRDRAEFIQIAEAGHFPFITKKSEFKLVIKNWWDSVRGSLR
jgi:proline iminopeptidase